MENTIWYDFKKARPTNGNYGILLVYPDGYLRLDMTVCSGEDFFKLNCGEPVAWREVAYDEIAGLGVPDWHKV